MADSAFGTSWRVGLLVLITALVWMFHHDRWTVARWQVPTDYVGDAHEILARIKAASEGDTWPLAPQVIERLGAPFGAHWNGYPTPDKPLMLALGGLSHLVGLFAAANAGLLLAQVAAALAFCFTLRWLRVRWEWALAGALLFAYTYHSFHRGLAHFSLVFTWTVPLGLLAVWLVAQSRRLHWRSSGAVVCFSVALALGIGNPYHLLFWGQLLLWALVAQWLGPRRRANLQIGIVAGAIAVGSFLVTNAEVWIYAQEPDGVPLLSRNYGGTERYALKPVEMFIPPQFHRLSFLAAFGQRYQRWSDWRGEDYMPYLGIVGIVGLAWLAITSMRRLFSRQGLPGQALSGGWLLAYATVGGLTNLLAFFAGFQVFRATSRVAIFISALVLVFLMVRLSRLTARWPVGWQLAAALALTTIGMLDQLPAHWPAEVYARMNADVESDVALGREMEAALPPGAMVFQLPVMGFPEVLPPYRLIDYEHFRPYLVTRSLRFSYGAAKFRSRSRWQRDLEKLPVPALVSRLEGHGFSALYVNRKGYEDRAELLLQELAALGYSRRLQGRGGQQVLVMLHPVAEPTVPLGESFTFGNGWHPRPEDGVRWANGTAVMSYFNPHEVPIRAKLFFKLVGLSPRQVLLSQNSHPVGSIATSDGPVDWHVPELTLSPGVNSFRLSSTSPAERRGSGPYQLRTFGLKDSSIEIIAAQNKSE